METQPHTLYCKATENPFHHNIFLGKRNIAELNTIGKGTLIAYKKEKHIFRKNNSLGLNYELLAIPVIPFHQIVIYLQRKHLTEPQVLYTTREFFLAKGQIYEFKNAGFEKQVFLPINQFGMERVNEYERLLSKQQSLF